MKTVKILVASVCVAFLAVSCQKNVEEIAPVQEKAQLTTITCAFPSMTDQNGTKVSLGVDGKTGWQVGDKIVIYGNPSSSDDTKRVVHEIEAGDIVNPEVAIFDVDFSDLDAQYDSGAEGTYYPFTVAYPYTDGQPYYLSTGENNYGRSRFQNTNQMLMAGHVSDDKSSIVLNQINAAITFSVSGDFDSYTFSGASGTEVVGYSSLVVEMNRRSLGEGKYRQKYNNSGTSGDLTSIQGTVNGNGTAVNHIFLPVNAQKSGDDYILDSQRYADVVYLPAGFTIKFFKGGNLKKYITSTAPLIIKPGHMINLGVLPPAAMHDYVAPTVHNNTIGVDMSTAYDLSASATANCYLLDSNTEIAANKAYKFKAATGKGGAALTNIGGDEDKDVVVLWETINTDIAPSVGTVISAVDYDQQSGEDAYIVFKMPATITPGNAVIAAKNSAGQILWSWHIWVPSTTVASGAYGVSTPNMMDRNLGALVVAGSGSISANGMMYQWGRKDPFVCQGAHGSSTLAKVAGVAESVSSTELTIAQSIANPTEFSIAATGDKYYWNVEKDKTLWGSSKTEYDPCPPGYKVPYNSESILFSTNVTEIAGFNYDSANYCVTIGSTVFPLAGRLHYSKGTMDGKDTVMKLWSAKCSSNGLARWLSVSGATEYNYWDERSANACSIRCVVDE